MPASAAATTVAVAKRVARVVDLLLEQIDCHLLDHRLSDIGIIIYTAL